MGTKVFLNIYDLVPANEFLYPVGFGFHHSGVEIMGCEYSFASGAGVFESSDPKEAPGAKYRESIVMGTFEGGSNELRRVMDNLKNEFTGDSYNLVFRNCNHFANALCWALLKKKVPGYVNRLAEFGRCCSCLLPKELLENAPVGHEGGSTSSNSSNSGGSGFVSGGNSSTSDSKIEFFSGAGNTLGSSSATSNTTGSGFGSRLMSAVSTSSSASRNEDLTDRREKVRQARMNKLLQQRS